MESNKLDRLPFQIAAVSSCEEDFPPEELLVHNHTPLAKGWRSERFCIFPQVLVLKLAPGNCRLRKIQILSHHFMIPIKLEFFIGRSVRPLGTLEKGILDEMQTYDPMLLPAPPWAGMDKGDLARRDISSAASAIAEPRPSVSLEDVESRGADGVKKVEFTRLGRYTSTRKGDYVKIQLQKNFINTLNLYNQVGIKIRDADYFVNAVNESVKTLAGLDPLISDPEWQPPHNNENAALWDLAFSIYHDEDIAKMIAMILNSKEAAVKALKILYQLAKKAGEEIARLQVTKAQAVEYEDFEMADDVKVCWTEENEKHEIIPHEPPRVVVPPPMLPTGPYDARTVDPPPTPPSKPIDPIEVPLPRPMPELLKTSKEIALSTSNLAEVEEKPAANSLGLDNPEPLTEEQSDEFDKLIRVFGAFVVRCLLSRQFKLREWALEEVARRLDAWEVRRKKKMATRATLGGRLKSNLGEPKPRKGVSWGRSKSRDRDRNSSQGSDGDESEGSASERETIKTNFTDEVKAAPVETDAFISASLEVVKKGLDDSREKVAILSLSLVEFNLQRICVSLSTLFFDLLMKSSDLNPRIKSGCADLLLSVENAYHSMPHSVLPFLTRVLPKKKGAVEFRYKTFGVDEDGEKSLGLSLESAMAFTEPQFQNKNHEVRESAVKVVVELVMRVDEDALSPYLQNVKPQLIQIIKDKITEARGKTVKPRAKKRPQGPWKENLLTEPETNAEVESNHGGKKKLDNVKSRQPSVPRNEKEKELPSSTQPLKKEPPPPKCGLQNSHLQFYIDPSPKLSNSIVPEETDDPALNWTMDKTCIFCERKSDGFTEENLDFHYWKECPMLCNCPLCNLVRDDFLVSFTLNSMIYRFMVRECPRCREAIMASEFNNHLSRGTCIRKSTLSKQIINHPMLSFLYIVRRTSMPIMSQRYPRGRTRMEEAPSSERRMRLKRKETSTHIPYYDPLCSTKPT
ncbi:hypothetical protein BC829DRAFT_394433 [Chytridium lagenaria]|nr:hypothetical protein BC829DRAFT_394433 [Chytridium lagenaria]